MLFNSYIFLLFLPIVLLVFFAIGRRGHHQVAIAWLIGSSLFYYAWWNPIYLGLILASVLFNYAVGVALSGEAAQRRPILIFGIAANLGLLGYFKYANFFVDNLSALSGASFQLAPIFLPLAISFFTFQQVAFLVDAYRGETHEYNFLHYCLFITFFPQLIAGPIVHHKEIIPQFARDEIYEPQMGKIAVGLTLFIIGLFKKVVIADGVALYATPVFRFADQGGTLSFVEAWCGALAYTFQLYYDFSAYSDMAIGIGALFGIKLPLNFNSPYKANNIIEFWRRWHMTLSRFLRDYLYIALGGNRKGTPRRYVNLMLTMVLGGLWHGAGWSFVIWGALHGVYLAINHAWHALRRALGLADRAASLLWSGAGRALTFLAVVVGWVFFRAETVDGALAVLRGMAGLNGLQLPLKLQEDWAALSAFGIEFSNLPLYDGSTELGFLLALMLHVWFAPNAAQFLSRHQPALETYPGEVEALRWKRLAWRPTPVFAAATAALAAAALIFFVRESEFLYFQF